MQKTKKDAANTQDCVAPPVLLKRIGSTTYKVSIHFSQTSKDTMADIVRRILEREVENYAA